MKLVTYSLQDKFYRVPDSVKAASSQALPSQISPQSVIQIWHCIVPTVLRNDMYIMWNIVHIYSQNFFFFPLKHCLLDSGDHQPKKGGGGVKERKRKTEGSFLSIYQRPSEIQTLFWKKLDKANRILFALVKNVHNPSFKPQIGHN